MAALFIYSPAKAIDVTATRLDGESLSGELASWSGADIVLTTPQGNETIRLPNLLSLRFAAESKTRDANAPLLGLVDGSQLPISEFRVAGTRATVAIAATNADSTKQNLTLSTSQIAAVRLQALSPAVLPQWDEIRQLNLPSDLLVLATRGGESLDHVESVLGDVTSDKIEFKLDGDSTRADRAAVAGLIYFHRESRPAAEPICIVTGRGGLRAFVLQASMSGDALRMKTVSGVEFVWPQSELLLADFSAGKVAYLSDLEPSTERWTPLVGLPSAAAAASAFGRVRRDRSPFDKPLALWVPDDAAPDGRGHERSFAKGLAIRSRMELVYRLPSGFRRFSAVAGIDPSTSASGNVRLTIQADERTLLETEIAGEQPPKPIELDVAGVRRLTIIVDYGRNLDTGDWLILGDARVVK
jgi:hypothetical protein